MAVAVVAVLVGLAAFLFAAQHERSNRVRSDRVACQASNETRQAVQDVFVLLRQAAELGETEQPRSPEQQALFDVFFAGVVEKLALRECK